MSNNLILRALTSPYNDITKASVLSHSDVDGNFIFLKGNIIYTAITDGSNVILKKYNGDDFSISTGFKGGIVTGDTTFLNGLTANTISTNDITLSGTSLTSILDNTVKKYSQTLTSPTAGRYTITHNLGTTDISVSLWLAFSNELTNAKILNRLPNSVDVEFSVSPSEDVLVLIMGTTVNSSGVAYIYSAVTVGPNQIVYGDATGLITSNSTFVRNPISGNIGVGVTSPSAKLHINNTGTDNTVLFEDNTNPDSTPFVIDNNGNVGIGTSTPDSKLVIKGINSSSSNYGLKVQNSGGTNSLVVRNDNQVMVNADNTPGDIRFYTKANGSTDYPLYVANSGNVGIFGVMGSGNILANTGGDYDVGFQIGNQFNETMPFRVKNYNNQALFAVFENGFTSTNGRANFGSNASSLPDSIVQIIGSDSSTGFGLKVKNSGGTDNFVVRNDGNVGIGVSSPSYKLNVNGNTYIKSDKVGVYSVLKFDPDNTGDHNFILGYTAGAQSSFEVRGNSDTYLTNKYYGYSPSLYIESASSKMKLQHINSDTYLYLGSVGTGTSFNFVTSGFTNLMTIKGNGNVGIGTTAPTSTLDINGTNGYNQLRLRTSFTPTGSTDTRGNVGDIAWDVNNFYWKTSTQWLRVSGQTF